MSCLKLHWPVLLSLYSSHEATEGPAVEETDGPVILKFPGVSTGIAGRMGPANRLSVLERARVLHTNRCCPECHRAAVVPVDAEPALAFRNDISIPGAGELIGFHCESCGHDWEV